MSQSDDEAEFELPDNLFVQTVILFLGLIFSWIWVLWRCSKALYEIVGDHPRVASLKSSSVALVAEPQIWQKRSALPAPVIIRTPPDAVPMAPAAVNEKKKRMMPFVGENQLALPTGENDKCADVPAFKGDPLPPLSILDPPRAPVKPYSQEALDRISRSIGKNLLAFGVEAKVVAAQAGPVITRFELQLAPGIKAAKIKKIAGDLARSISVPSIVVEEVIWGKPYVGLHIPNQDRDTVMLSEILQSEAYLNSASMLSLALGKDVCGIPAAFDLSKASNLFVSGPAGSGKSVAINVMILSMLYKATAEQVRFIFIDPKMLELSVYDNIPHLLTPVVTDMKDAANALRWCVAEMERRYQLMTRLGVRNLGGLNRKVEDAAKAGTPIMNPLAASAIEGEPPPQEPLKHMPHIVIVIDELADMMMVVGKKVEELIARLAQKARAAGIYLIVASRAAPDELCEALFGTGASICLEKWGDMKFRRGPEEHAFPLHGAFVDDHEVHKVVVYLKQVGKPEYIEDVLADEPDPAAQAQEQDAEQDPLYDQAVAIVMESRKASISWVQRRLSVGYNRAARMVEQMERAGLVGPSGAGGNREILK